MSDAQQPPTPELPNRAPAHAPELLETDGRDGASVVAESAASLAARSAETGSVPSAMRGDQGGSSALAAPHLSQGTATGSASGSAAEQAANSAADAAKDVSETAKSEGAAVVSETKDQLQDLYQQTRTELREAAGQQQERVATGLQTVSEDLGSMSSGDGQRGLAHDLVAESSRQLGKVATWLNEREPGDVLNEVKTFARRQPGVFIGVAAIAGVVAGRLTRALTANASDERDEHQGGGAQ